MSLDKAILGASEKNYADFEKEVQKELDAKMTTTLGSFMKYLDKNTFAKKEK